MAASIGKLALSLASATNENTLALAHLNFDFSVVKIAAPVEYQGLGLALTSQRRTAAEDGHFHIVARKLAALFWSDLPEVPALERAYGERATEIATDPVINPKGRKTDGPFQDLVGVDGTTIWAAATSGKGGIAVHLLACMLARIFPGPEAVSIWVELVDSRKAHLRQSIEGDKFHLGNVTTSVIEVDRQQLAQWDASARAWLRSADTAYVKKQKQLMLIIDNLGGSLASGSDIYHVVVDAWKTAMSLMDKIVSGMPHSVEHPELMLALSSWHLYPDMTILHGKVKTVRQNDPLVTAGGIITLGLHNPNVLNDLGISWSLPLSHLRYYGKPVMRTGSVGIKRSRVSMDELVFVTLGCVISGWGQDSSNLHLFARFIQALLGKYVRHEHHITPPTWLKLLGKGAKNYLCLDPQARKEADSLAAFGRRRCHSFLASSKEHLPVAFNLGDPATLVHLIKGAESQIVWLRKMALERITEQQRNKLRKAVIRYRPGLIEDTPPPSTNWTQPDLEDHEYSGHKLSEWASLLPQQQTRDGPPIYRRWIPSTDTHSHLCSSKKYKHILTSAAERRLMLEHSSKEPCTIFTALDEGDSLFGKENVKKDKSNQSLLNEPTRHIKVWAMDMWAIDSQPMFQGLAESELMTVSVKSSPISTTPSEAAEPVSLLSTLGPAKFNEVSPRSLQSRSSTGAFFSRPPKPSNGKIETEAQRMLRITNQFLQETRTLPTAVLDMRPDGASQKANYSCIDESPLSLPTTSAYQEQCCPYKWHVPIKTIPQEQNPYEAQNKHSYKDLDVVSYDLQFGSSSSIGIFVPVQRVLDDVTHPAAAYLPTHFSIEELVNMLESEVIDIQALDRHLSGIASSFWGSGYKDHLESLEALHFAAEIYSHLMDATIDLEITSKSLNHYGWAQNIRNTKLERPKALSCIAAFESGNLNIHPSDLKDVMGISTGNSLYIAEYLWMDPYERPSPLVIKRSIGNIGKPGLAFLISPTNPNMKEPDYSSWVNIPHENFDGNCEGTFEKTSLHLSFTGYESSLSASEHGLFDKQVYFLQAVVQVFDAGAWVADLDLVTALDGDFGTNYLRRLPQANPKSKINPTTERASMEKAEEEPNSCIAGVQIITSPAVPELLGSETVEMISFRDQFCDHSAEESQDFSVIGQLTSLDCWDEILDTPNNACVVRTNGDWLARLAAAVVGLQKLRPVIVAPKKKVCWACVQCINVGSKATMIIVC